MNIHVEKINLIQWLSNLEDAQIVKQLLSLRESNISNEPVSLSNEEKKALDIGLESISNGAKKSHRDVMKLTKEKFPNLKS